MTAIPTLMHYSAKPLLLCLLENRKQEEIQGCTPSPRGLWVSVPGEQDWPAWCRSERFATDSFVHASEVILKPDAKVLVLSSPDEIHRLASQWGDLRDRWGDRTSPDWRMVARTYQAIVIAPYQWSCRLNDDCAWYYGWDCASGCIWDVSAIDRIEAREPPSMVFEDETEDAA